MVIEFNGFRHYRGTLVFQLGKKDLGRITQSGDRISSSVEDCQSKQGLPSISSTPKQREGDVILTSSS